MTYFRRVVKRRPACMTDEEWLSVWNRGKAPRLPFRPRDGDGSPSADVRDLVDMRILSDLRWRLEALCMAMLEPKVNGKGSSSSTLNVRAGELLSAFSEIWAFLTETTYATGRKRLTGRLSLSLGVDGLKVTLTDDTTGTYCTRTAECLDDALLALEVGLKEGSLNWLPSSYVKGKK